MIKKLTVDGEKLMAINTVPNPIRYVDTGVCTFFGYPVPSNVRVVEVWDRPTDNDKKIVWKIHGSDVTHDISFPHITEENILAVLAAMRLSC